MAVTESLQTKQIPGLEYLQDAVQPQRLDGEGYLAHSLKHFLDNQQSTPSTYDLEQALLDIVEPPEGTRCSPLERTIHNHCVTGKLSMPLQSYTTRNLNLTDTAIAIIEMNNGDRIFDIIPRNFCTPVTRFWFDHSSSRIEVRSFYRLLYTKERNVGLHDVKGFHVIYGRRTDRRFNLQPDSVNMHQG